jgi:GNAT superfamily N-acetyltransferase
MNIERLSDERFPEFCELVERSIAEAQFSQATLDVPSLQKLIQSPNVVYFLAIEDNKIIGSIGGAVIPYFFSTRKKAGDLGFYVEPEYRGSRAAIKLVNALESWAKEKGIEDLYLGQTTGVDVDKTQDFYERLGYKVVGVNTIKHLKD